jgi:hypothetical protein
MMQPEAVITATTQVIIGEAPGSQVALAVSTATLPADGQATAVLTVTVTDVYGDPVTGQLVQIGVEGDGQMGTISGGEVISGTTDVNGQYAGVLTAGTIPGQGAVQADLLVDDGASGLAAANGDRKEVELVDTQPNRVYLPLVDK